MSFLLVALALVLPGCPGPSASTDAGSGSDANLPDTNVGTVDTGTGTVDTGTGTADTGSTGDVARCQASAAALAATCPSDGTRTCQVAAYGSYCNSDASPGLLADAIDCLTAMSSASGGCRTFSDPSGANTCIDAVYADVNNAAVDAAIARIDTLCTGMMQNPARTEPPLFALTPAQLSALQSCLDAATDCAGTASCAAGFEGPIMACFP